MFGKGKHTGRQLVQRLRSENGFYERQIRLMQVRLRKASELVRTEASQREMAEGIVLQQTAALQAKNERIAELEQELAERTVEMPIPAAA